MQFTKNNSEPLYSAQMFEVIDQATTVGIIAIALAVLCAYTLKGFSGFGPALIMMPALSVALSPQEALALSAIVDAAVGIAMLSVVGMPQVAKQLIGRAVGALAIGTVIGTVAIGFVPERILLITVGLAVIVLAIRLVIHRTLPSQPSLRATTVGCFTGGISGGLVGISGPFVVANITTDDKQQTRRLFTVIFLIESLVKTVVLTIIGIVDVQIVLMSLWLTPAVVIGFLIGNGLHHRIDETTFTHIVVGILVIIGLQACVVGLVG